MKRWLAALSVMLAFTGAAAAELTQAQADATYAIAYGYSGFIPVKAPDLHVVPRAQLCERAGLPAACALRGLSAPDGAVYLDDALDFSEPVDASILLHELVCSAALHALQLRAHPQDAARYPGDGSWRFRSRLDAGRDRRARKIECCRGRDYIY